MRNDPRHLRELARRMGRMSVDGSPINEALLDLFDHAIEPGEAEYLLAMGSSPLTRSQAVARSGLEEGPAGRLFESVLRKNLLTRVLDGAGDTYQIAPYLPGWFETQLFSGDETDYQREFARRMDRYIDSLRAMNKQPVRLLSRLYLKATTSPHQTIIPGSPKARRVVVDQAIEVPPSQVLQTNTVLDLIEKPGRDQSIALVHCFCRQWKKLVGEPCRFHLPAEACILLGQTARQFVEKGPARSISRDEALSIVQSAQKAGAVHTVFHDRDDVRQGEMAICNCCWDCCGIYGSYNRGGGAMHLRCTARVVLADAAQCTRCGRCATYCPVDAIAVGERARGGPPLRIDDRRCIGCGQCAFQCARGALAMRADERDVVLGFLDPKKARIPPKA